jgi:hypothetical protein
MALRHLRITQKFTDYLFRRHPEYKPEKLRFRLLELRSGNSGTLFSVVVKLSPAKKEHTATEVPGYAHTSAVNGAPVA